MSKKKRNKASKRQRQTAARVATPTSVAPQAASKVASPAPDVVPMASAAARAEPTHRSARPAPAPAPVGAPAQVASKTAPTLDAQLADETPRFWVGAATLAAGGFLLASVVTALVKGVPAEGQSVKATTAAVHGLIDMFGALGLIVASGTLVALMVWALVTMRRLAWLPIGGALPLLAVGCAWLFGQGRLGAMFAGDLRILGGVLGAVVLSGATLALAHAFGWSITDYLRRERDEAASDADDEREAVRPLQRAAPQPVVAETKRSAPETKKSAAVVAPTPTPTPTFVAPITVTPVAAPVATSFATPVATPIAPIAPKPAPASVVAPLGTAAAAAASGDLEVRILKRGQPVPAKGEIAVEPHEGEINEPRPYTPPSKPVATIVAAAAPRREVSFVSVESGAVAAAAAGPALRPKISDDAVPFTPRGAAPAVVEVEAPEEEIDEDEDEFEDDEEYASDEEDDLDDEESEESDEDAVAPAATAVAAGDDDGWVEVDGDDDEEDEDDDEDEDDEDEDEDEEEEEEEEVEWIEGDDPELSAAPLAGDDLDEEEADEEEDVDEDESLVVAAELADDESDADEADEDDVLAPAVAEPAVALASDDSKRQTPTLDESDADVDANAEPVTELAPAARAPRKRSRGRGRGREAQPSLFEAPAEPAPAMDIDDKLVYEAGRLFLDEGRVAVSMLQRRFGLDFKQSTAILDQLQQRGLIGPYLGGSRREILMDAKTWRAAVAQGA